MYKNFHHALHYFWKFKRLHIAQIVQKLRQKLGTLKFHTGGTNCFNQLLMLNIRA